ncbi:Ppx/GppA phosphatase family protein [Auraticoccus monumenti]|uniref:Exopolyphosphatase / guanosine-5'-triphosphate,3'-diphosphate pyrophosphatase n=1 Tax=Auraticoccus monumenti TaxID=675864 RepID=A0A1G6YW39_9ACTN|nr:Ppx/GppA phosphatase family protein [Auraticoccus monumenti]SDD93796.1 exopolyphosphatase / guanosine-5'-triphosphate,3'-diphosphate pyrophosphatase [Auraticoccus monumenti]
MTTHRRFAAVDCGTNSIRLLVADDDGHGGLTQVDRRLEMVRLGQGVDATGQFHPDALARTFAACDDYAAVLRELDVPAAHVRFVATSAARDAGNAEEFFTGVRSRLGVEAEIITGSEEAVLSFAGAVGGIGEHEEPVLVVDIGGGSTELVLGEGGRILAATSLDIGSVRLRERLLHGDPPSQAEILATREHVDAQLDASGVPLDRARTWVGVAGTMTTLSAVQQGLPVYDPSKVHGSTIAVDELCLLADSIVHRSVRQLRDIPSMHPMRADVISAGAVIAERIAQRVQAPALTVSESDILDGIVLELVGRPA